MLTALPANMPPHHALTRRSLLALLGAAVVHPVAFAQSDATRVTVHKNPSCGCCLGWVQHIQRAGFVATVIDHRDMDAVKDRLGVPADLASCHTAEIAGYIVEGHVPASAIRRLLTEKPNAIGLAVPGMPAGAPGMGTSDEVYEAILFGLRGARSYMRFVGEREI